MPSLRAVLAGLTLLVALPGTIVSADAARPTYDAARELQRRGPAPTVGPSSAVAGEPLRVRASVPTKVRRPVILQRRTGPRWTDVTRKRSSTKGKVAFTVPAARLTLRVVAPAAGGQKGYTSRSTRFVPKRSVPSIVAHADDLDVSASGRYVAFSSTAGDPSGHSNVFTWDRDTGSLDMLTYLVTPGDANGDNLQPSISADGRTVAFTSYADNLVPGDTNGSPDVVLWESGVGFSTVSVDDAGIPAPAGAQLPSLSDDARTVAFATESALEATDTNGHSDIYVRFRDDNLTAIASRTAGFAGANAPTYRSELSGDGRWVVLETAASDLAGSDANSVSDIYRVNLYGAQVQNLTQGGNGPSSWPSVSFDGGRVAFATTASNLAAGTGPGLSHILVWEASSSRRSLVSRATGSGGAPADAGSAHPAISGDGRVVAFLSFATNLAGSTTHGDFQAFARHLSTRVTSAVSVTANQAFGQGDTTLVALDHRGRYAALRTAAPRVAGDSDGLLSAYLVDLRG